MKLQLIFLIIVLMMACGSVDGQMIARISEDVETDFGTYHPYPAVFTHQVPLFTLAPDFGNVENKDILLNLSDEDSALLFKNHFVVQWSRYKQLYDIYNECTWSGTPVFVSTDAVLHIYHVLFDQVLADIEVKKFVETLDTMTGSFLQEMISIYETAQKTEVMEAARRNIAYLSVTRRLLGKSEISTPAYVQTLVDSEMVFIENHDGFHVSPIFGPFSALDYSQFQPRGHYTKNDTLKAYFKSMMWLGWTIFTMEPQLFGDLARQHTLQALLLTQAGQALQVNEQSVLDLWSCIYEPTVFFVGKTDDPCIKDYLFIAEQVYGTEFLVLSPDELYDITLLDQFMAEAQKLPGPKIPNWIYGTFITYKGFRLMGQRFIPDSYMFAHLVLPEVDSRFFPKGLDIMAILGSDRAYTLLDSVYHETIYPNYAEKIAEFKTEFKAKSDQDWAQNLYWNWLYCLMPLLYQKDSGYPLFMQTLAWTDKELMAALASWAELRHDTILYAKQSMSPCGIAPGPPKSYVEPNPHLYARLASLVKYTREGLDGFDLLLEGYQEKLELFENLLLFLSDVSVKELENVPLSDEEYENIYCFGKVMQNLVSYVKDPDNPWEMDADDMAVVADVHTDSNSDQCLEEGVGYPLEVYVIVNEGNHIRLTRGAIFSYYEFLQPITSRLTDEAWREMLAGDSPPDLPEWTNSFMDENGFRPSPDPSSPDNLYHGEFNAIQPAGTSLRPLHIRLLQNHPNPFNRETVITFDIPHPMQVSLNIYNILGQKVATLTESLKSAGRHTVHWRGINDDGFEVSSGIYLCCLNTEKSFQVNKMFLLK